ncbi:sensor histidine kinase [Knoellia locipacati]|uniref:histidine kinase n=1 Tax=Knoellia locipacati TaxID=882824 RepID=A0A512SVR2_9MICO|nr:histidine kinase [Knoellia locipacati]GEQ12039.1 two-component sensor histidine kinase [Knoellia locipacati]
MSDVWGDERPTRRQLLFDVAVALLFGLVMFAIHVSIGAGAAAATVLLAVALGVRRVSWQLMSAFAVAGSLAQVIAPGIAYLATTAYAVLFATLGSHRDLAARRFGLVAAAVAVVGAATYGALGGASEFGTGRRVVMAVALGSTAAVFCFGGWAWGYLRWQQRQSVQARIDARIEAVERRRVTELYDIEQERLRIAADMHDVVAHSWAVVAAQSDGARYALQDSPADAARALEVIGETARAAMGDLRTIVAQLRDPALQPSTPGSAQQTALVERMHASGMDLRLAEHGTPDGSPLVALTAYRLLGEALTNALKHGDLSRPVDVQVDWTDGYRLTVTNSIGPAPEEPRAGGHGLVGMSERAHVAGGTFSAGRDGDVWRVEAHLPTSSSSSSSSTSAHDGTARA